jgi:hypothetical protein
MYASGSDKAHGPSDVPTQALDQLRTKYEADMEFVATWTSEREQMNSRISFLSTSFDEAVIRQARGEVWHHFGDADSIQAEVQAQNVDLTVEVRELKLAVDSLAGEKRSLAEAKRQTDIRLKEICDEFVRTPGSLCTAPSPSLQIHTSNHVVSSSGAASALKLERDSLRSEANALEEKVQHELARRKTAEAKLVEMQDSVAKERRQAAQLGQGNVCLRLYQLTSVD